MMMLRSLLAGGLAASAALALNAGKRPLFIYMNANVNWAGQMCEDIMWNLDNGATHVLLSFLINGKPNDATIAWDQLGSSGQKACIQRAHAAGGKVLLATGGATEEPYFTTDPVAYGRTAAEQALRLNLDGVDFDLENLPPGFELHPHYDWILKSTISCRETFDRSGRAGMEITHAPQAPYFTTWAGAGGGYMKLAKEWGNKVDFYLIQYYNQEVCEYATYETLFLSHPGCWAERSSVKELQAQLGALGNKLVVGKPALVRDLYNTGYIAPAHLNQVLCKAETELGYTGGLMVWSYNGMFEPLMKAFYDSGVGGQTCGEGGSAPAPPPVSPPAPAPTTTTTKAPVVSPPPVNPPPVNPPPSSGGEGCYASSVWWTADCTSGDLCQLHAGLTSQGACTSSGKPNAVWVKSLQECQAAMKSSGACL